MKTNRVEEIKYLMCAVWSGFIQKRCGKLFAYFPNKPGNNRLGEDYWNLSVNSYNSLQKIKKSVVLTFHFQLVHVYYINGRGTATSILRMVGSDQGVSDDSPFVPVLLETGTLFGVWKHTLPLTEAPSQGFHFLWPVFRSAVSWKTGGPLQ